MPSRWRAKAWTRRVRPSRKGGVSKVTVDLKAGEYEYYCPVDDHAQAGMEGTLTVG